MKDEYEIAQPPVAKWRWHVIGDDTLVIDTIREVPWWRRMLTRLTLGSRWERL